MGSAESERYDQVLDSVLVGPVVTGSYRFVFQADPPDPTKLPVDDIVGVTAILLTCSYRGKEFIRVGYYLNNEYTDEELRENPPSRPQIDRLSRNILADKPRVTKFPIDFDPVPGFGGAQQWQQQQPGVEAGSAPSLPVPGDRPEARQPALAAQLHPARLGVRDNDDLEKHGERVRRFIKCTRRFLTLD